MKVFECVDALGVDRSMDSYSVEWVYYHFIYLFIY